MRPGLISIFLSILFTVILAVSAGCTCTPGDPLGGKIYSYSPATDTGEKQPGTFTVPQTSTTPQQNSTAAQVQEVERQVTVTAGNSVFSIGLPPGYSEEREITASKPIDIWFEYLAPDMTLEINGSAVEIPARRTTAKTGYVAGATRLTYVIKNPSSQYLSYNLRMLPANAEDQVPVVTKEKWTAP